MISETDARAAWTHALRNPGAPPRPIDCGSGISATVGIDETPDGRFARVTLRRESDLSHDESVPLASQLYVLGRFEPFPVDSVRGADGRTWHYSIDLGRYKEHRAEELRRQAEKLLAGRTMDGDDLEVAAIQLGVPIEQLLSSCDPRKAAAREPRTLQFLSDKFQVPERWIATQLSLYESGELSDG